MSLRTNGPRTRAVCEGLLAPLLLCALALAAGETAAAASQPSVEGQATPAATDSQRHAGALLERMTQYLAGLPAFSVAFHSGYDAVQPSGQKIEFGETRRITMARPDRLRIEEVSSDGKRDLAVFDGRTISAFNADDNVYAQAPQPGGLDDALAYFVRELRMRMPLALLLTSRLPEVLPARVRTVDYVESTEILGRRTHHIAGRTDSTDFQFWIADGERPLPLRVVITYVQAPGQPQFWANFADWNTSPKLEPGTFQFMPPKDARQIAFAVQVRRAGSTAPSPGANGELQP